MSGMELGFADSGADAFVAELKGFIPMAQRLGCRQLILLSGKRVLGASVDEQQRASVETLKRAAEVLGAAEVYIGAVEPDSSGYPDCRPEYYRAFNEVVRAGTKEGTIRVVTPLIAMHKTEIVRLGLELNAPFDLTWSCYQREDRACGVCDSCVLRLRAFREAGAEDPIPYAESAVRLNQMRFHKQS